MELDDLKDLINKEVIYCGQNKTITGIHIYINKNGITAPRIHLKNSDGYVKLNEIQIGRTKYEVKR